MATFRVKDFDRASFPALYRCADDASLSGQRWYLSWLTANLCLLLIGTVIGSINLSELHQKRIAQVIAALIFFAAMNNHSRHTQRWNVLVLGEPSLNQRNR